MLKRYLSIVLLLVIALSCSKDKFNTSPSIQFKSINGNEFLPGSTVVISLGYRDKEGDLGNGTLTYIRNRTNIKPIANPAANQKADTVNSALPEFPNTMSGDISVLIPYSFLDEDPLPPNDSAHASIYNDTMVFKILVKDVLGHVSDTITTPQVIQRSF